MHKLSLLLALCGLIAFTGCPSTSEPDDDDTADDDDDDSVGDDDDDSAPIDADGDGSELGVDCNDDDASIYPAAPEICDGLDNDCDGAVPLAEVDADGDGIAACADDCDDLDPSVAPGAAELCDGLDNDCDGSLPADEADADGDGWASCAGDCDDADDARHPGASEADCADPVDYNCDGLTGYEDADGDGFAACEECDDGDSAINPAASESCNGADDDCDGEVDEDLLQDFYLDADGDGFGRDDSSVSACSTPADYSADAGDCDDLDAGIAPGADEGCDGIDTDCDGAIPDEEVDGDGDGTSTCEGDCDDSSADIGPHASEIGGNGLDDDCDGEADPLTAVVGAGEGTCGGFTLDGSGSFGPGAEALGWAWEVVAVPPGASASLDDATSATPMLSTSSPGTFTVRLTVNQGSATESVEADVVIPLAEVNNPPVPDPGAIAAISETALCSSSAYSYMACGSCASCDTVDGFLFGSAVDPDGDSVTYLWEVLDGEATVADPESAVVSVSATGVAPPLCDDSVRDTVFVNQAGSQATFRLTATDCNGTSASVDTVVDFTCEGIFGGHLGYPDFDNDGILSINEDPNGDSILDEGETAYNDPDTDGDGILDGTEIGLTEPESDATDLSFNDFLADADPTTTTDPTVADTDGGGVDDGDEDCNANGAVDEGESDPNDPTDDGTISCEDEPVAE